MREITVLSGETATQMLHALARHCNAQPGEFVIRVRAGGRAGNATFDALRAELGDEDAAIVSIPTLAATHWAAISGTRCAVVAVR